MTHLTDEQIESILQGESLKTDHLNSCELCQSRLKEKQALATRLKTAFAGVVPSEMLAQKIRSQSASNAPTEHMPDAPRLLNVTYRWRKWAGTLSTVAAMLLLGLLLKATLMPSPAYADLVEIHQHNLVQGSDYVAQTDPNILAAHFQKTLGFNPRIPELNQGLQLRGCCIKHFKDHVVGSYVVDTPEGIISIVAVQDEPAAMDMKIRSKVRGHTYFHSQFAKCDMIAVRIENYTYCGIGEVSPDYLQTLLEKLMP
jgi:hypothetical protein